MPSVCFTQGKKLIPSSNIGPIFTTPSSIFVAAESEMLAESLKDVMTRCFPPLPKSDSDASLRDLIQQFVNHYQRDTTADRLTHTFVGHVVHVVCKHLLRYLKKASRITSITVQPASSTTSPDLAAPLVLKRGVKGGRLPATGPPTDEEEEVSSSDSVILLEEEVPKPKFKTTPRKVPQASTSAVPHGSTLAVPQASAAPQGSSGVADQFSALRAPQVAAPSPADFFMRFLASFNQGQAGEVAAAHYPTVPPAFAAHMATGGVPGVPASGIAPVMQSLGIPAGAPAPFQAQGGSGALPRGQVHGVPPAPQMQIKKEPQEPPQQSALDIPRQPRKGLAPGIQSGRSSPRSAPQPRKGSPPGIPSGRSSPRSSPRPIKTEPKASGEVSPSQQEEEEKKDDDSKSQKYEKVEVYVPLSWKQNYLKKKKQ